ncbi:MAG: hypothetical protein C4533_00465 [Candidatus Omnitrophota bacterium]|jgi:hypothetical protein|nr:MAG: hypothetical protein C4533_00465 [Candidatus Omnitrophota bacterium]
MEWDKNTEDKFKLFISKIPIFHRGITEIAVRKRAEENAISRKSAIIQEQDVLSAFFSDVPSPFYSMMVRVMEQSGFDYKKYGFPKSTNPLVGNSSNKPIK